MSVILDRLAKVEWGSVEGVLRGVACAGDDYTGSWLRYSFIKIAMPLYFPRFYLEFERIQYRNRRSPSTQPNISKEIDVIVSIIFMMPGFIFNIILNYYTMSLSRCCSIHIVLN